MHWWNIAEIPKDRNDFIQIIYEFIFECPSCVMKRNGYIPVSNRRCSFREKGIDGSLLLSCLALARKQLGKKRFIPIESNGDFEDIFKNSIEQLSFQDPFFEVVFYRKRSDMSDVEAIYYYIRNAFAHGSFQFTNNENNEPIYILESSKNNRINARMRLKGQTLLHLVDIKKMKASDIRSKKKKR